MQLNNQALFFNSTLNKMSTMRNNAAWLALQQQEQNALFIPIVAGEYLFSGQDIVVLTAPQYVALLDLLAGQTSLIREQIFLGCLDLEGDVEGLDQATRSAKSPSVFVLNIAVEKLAPLLAALSEHLAIAAELKPFLRMFENDKEQALAIFGFGRALAIWHDNSRFCGLCGHATRFEDGGYRRVCENSQCSKEHFPRIDPAVIMLVEYCQENGDKLCLLAQHQRHSDGEFSTLAGFVDPGESLEDAVIREVKEEVGLDVDKVSYLGSQPWPFPSSLMLGFTAQATSLDLHIDDKEITTAKWFTVEQLKACGSWGDDSQGDKVPGLGTIARDLMETWLKSNSK